MTAPFGSIPDWWTLFARAPFGGATPGSMPGGASLQQFIAACEQHIALMQALAAEIGKGAEDGGPPLFERLGAWLRTVESGRTDPFGVLRNAGAFGASATQGPLSGSGRIPSLQSRALELHARMLVHGADIAREALQRFAARSQQASPDPASLYSAWIECAESAYADRAHRADYCQTQAELINALNELRREQRSQVEDWARVLDLPTRDEVNALIRRIVALEVAQSASQPSRGAKTGRPAPRPKKPRAPRKR